MSRLIRSPRARELQGCRAGIASRAVADVIDVAVAFLIYIAIVALANLVWDVFTSRPMSVSTPSTWVSSFGAFAVLVVYWAIGWGSTGRSTGKQVVGLRVVRSDSASLGTGGALVRAFLCALFYPGLLLALVLPRNQSLQDLVCRTVVVYDWIPESARPRTLAEPAT